MNNRMEIGLLLIRVVLGITFAIHGYDKFHSGIDNTAQWFASIGLPQFLTYVVALLELVGGILLTLGLAPELSALCMQSSWSLQSSWLKFLSDLLVALKLTWPCSQWLS